VLFNCLYASDRYADLSMMTVADPLSAGLI
jgi:hypothetical protein